MAFNRRLSQSPLVQHQQPYLCTHFYIEQGFVAEQTYVAATSC